MYCGLGGWSDGLVMEGFEVLGVEIEPKIAELYKHPILVEDVRNLRGEQFPNYDLIVGSPPCRDFSSIGRLFGSRWKQPPNPKKGLELITEFLRIVREAQPKFWVMENVASAKGYVSIKPQTTTYFQRGKKHCLWGQFPPFLVPQTNTLMWQNGPRSNPINPLTGKKTRKLSSWVSAKIPLPVARALGRAVMEKLNKIT